MARINTGTMTVGIFAVLFGLIGAYALRAALVTQEKPVAEPPRVVNVPLASYDLPVGRAITIGDMALMPMTQADLQARKYPLNSLMIQPDQLVGRILREPIPQGQPFLTNMLYPEGTGPSLAERLKPGLRAVTVPIDDMGSVGGSAVEGTFVDVLFRSEPREADPNSKKPSIPQATLTLIEGAEVLAVGRNAASGGRDASGTLDIRDFNRARSGNSIRSVTLAVTPEQAAILETVKGRGEILLTLRGEGTGGSFGEQMTLEDLLGLLPPQEPFITEIYRGGQRQETEFEDDRVIRSDALPIDPQAKSAPPATKSVPTAAPANSSTGLSAEQAQLLLGSWGISPMLDQGKLEGPYGPQYMPPVLWRGAVIAAFGNP